MNEQQAKNLQLWNSVFTTDPTAVKEITGKQYKGHSPDPYWIIEQATKHFGAAGIGWGVERDWIDRGKCWSADGCTTNYRPDNNGNG